jgi:hypothetical protein
MHVQDSLESYEGLVVDELDQELGTADEVVSSATVDVGRQMEMEKAKVKEGVWKEESSEYDQDEDEKADE